MSFHIIWEFSYNQKLESITRKIEFKLVRGSVFRLQTCRRHEILESLYRDLGNAISEVETFMWNLGDL